MSELQVETLKRMLKICADLGDGKEVAHFPYTPPYLYKEMQRKEPLALGALWMRQILPRLNLPSHLTINYLESPLCSTAVDVADKFYDLTSIDQFMVDVITTNGFSS